MAAYLEETDRDLSKGAFAQQVYHLHSADVFKGVIGECYEEARDP